MVAEFEGDLQMALGALFEGQRAKRVHRELGALTLMRKYIFA